MKAVTNRVQPQTVRFKAMCRHFWVGLAMFLWSCALAAAPPGADAPVSSTPEESWETLSVRELLQQDLQEVLRTSTQDPGVATLGTKPSVRPVMAPRLVALYGVGRALMAEVQVGQRAYLYVRGQPFPAGHTGDSGVYQLRGMNGACIQLERGEDRHSLCLRMLLGEVQP
ncbi:MAG: hypothetical protein WA968_02455 [Castellaniella sp.]